MEQNIQIEVQRSQENNLSDELAKAIIDQLKPQESAEPIPENIHVPLSGTDEGDSIKETDIPEVIVVEGQSKVAQRIFDFLSGLEESVALESLKSISSRAIANALAATFDGHRGMSKLVAKTLKDMHGILMDLFESSKPSLLEFEAGDQLISDALSVGLQLARQKQWKKFLGHIHRISDVPKARPDIPARPFLTDKMRDELTLTESVRRVNDLYAAVEKHVVGSQEAATLAKIGLLLNVNLLMVGLPGEAKTMFARSILSGLPGNKFDMTFSGNTSYESVLGLPDFESLRRSIWDLKARGLPQAHFAHADELFRANRQMLDSLLEILNERQISIGLTKIETPLMWAIAASNFALVEDHYKALLNRFPFRVAVGEMTSATDQYAAQMRLFMPIMPNVSIGDILLIRETVAGKSERYPVILRPSLQFIANTVATRLSGESEGSISLDRVSTRVRNTIPDLLRILAVVNNRNEVKLGDLEPALLSILAPAVMGDIGAISKANETLFAGVASRRASVKQNLGEQLQLWVKDERPLLILDKLLYLLEIIQLEGKVLPKHRAALEIDSSTDTLRAMDVEKLIGNVGVEITKMSHISTINPDVIAALDEVMVSLTNKYLQKMKQHEQLDNGIKKGTLHVV